MRLSALSLIAVCLLAAAAAGRSRVSADEVKQQVMERERSFAASMARRDFDDFARHVSDEAIFMSERGAERGKAAVLAAWRRYYDGRTAPFSWEPASVEVVDSGTLAYSSGPIRDAAGRRIGSFNSVWRLEAPGRWMVVFDRGCHCRDQSAPTALIIAPAPALSIQPVINR